MCSGRSACSVLAVTRLEVSRLAEVRQAARDPVGLPIKHGGQRHAWRTEKALRGGRVHEPGRGRLLAGDVRSSAEAFAKFLRKRAHADDVRPAYIDRRGRRRAM